MGDGHLISPTHYEIMLKLKTGIKINTNIKQ